jgi:hypothetical protein
LGARGHKNFIMTHLFLILLFMRLENVFFADPSLPIGILCREILFVAVIVVVVVVAAAAAFAQSRPFVTAFTKTLCIR